MAKENPFTEEQEQRIREIVSEEMDRILREPMGLTVQQFEQKVERVIREVLSQVLARKPEDRSRSFGCSQES